MSDGPSAVSGEPSTRPPARPSIASRESAATIEIEVAIDEVVRLMPELTVAIGMLAYAGVVHVCSELRRALSRAQTVAASLPRAAERALALHRIDKMRTGVARQLAIERATTARSSLGPEPANRRDAARSASREPHHMPAARRHMDQLERDVKRAAETFLAEITRAAQRAVIEAIRSAFGGVSAQAGHAMPSHDKPPSGEVAHRRALTRIDHAALRDRTVACIRQNPGWDAAQLGRSLGVYPSKLRRPLRELAKSGAIRFDERPAGFGEQQRRRYFVVEPTSGALHADHPVVPAEPPAIHLEAMA